MPTNCLPPTPTPPIEFIKELATTYPKAMSIGSPPCESLDTALNDPGLPRELSWRTAYGTARTAIRIGKEISDMLLPLEAVVGALAVLVKNSNVSPPQTFYTIVC